MGIDNPTLEFLAYCKRRGVNFSETLTLGRQGVHASSEEVTKFAHAIGLLDTQLKTIASEKYAEPLLHALGAQSVESVDASAYEDASILHDLNFALPEHMKSRFTAVCDFGTIEHVFHATRAFQSAMEAVAVGGHFLQVNVANNYLGHGFWQFSPELLFRMLSPANGFKDTTVLLYEKAREGRWFIVADPETLKARVTLQNKFETLIVTVAQKFSVRPIFSTVPQQSDYVEQWAREPEVTSSIDVTPYDRGLRLAKALLPKFKISHARDGIVRIDTQKLIEGKVEPKPKR